MRTITDAKNDFVTRGNTNGVYNFLERNVKNEARATFNRKPWYLTVNEKLKKNALSKSK